MATTSTLIDPVAQALKALLEGLDVDPGVKAYWPAPKLMDGTGPWAVVELPRLRRTGTDEAETELGSDDWYLSFPVILYVALSDAKRDQARLLDLLEAAIKAIDDNPSLGIVTVDDTSLIAGDPFFDLTEQARPLIAYECELEVWRRRTT